MGPAEWSPLDLAPGLYVAALALLLAGVLRRWYDPVPWRVLGAFALALGILFGSSLCGGKVLLPLDNLRGEVPFRLLPPSQPHGNLLQGDLVQLVVPALAAAERALSAGRWPLWNSRVGAGMPLLADPQAQALAPLAVLALPFSPVRGAAVMAAMRVFLALAFTFLLLRRQGLGEGPALTGALAFGLSGFMLLWVGWPLASSAALLPAVLYALVRLSEAGASDADVAAGAAGGDDLAGSAGSAPRMDSRGRPPAIVWRHRRDALLLALALAALLLAGHPETELYVCLLAAAFGADLVRQSLPGRRLPLLRRMAGAALVAAGVAAPALWPALDYLPQTLRAERLAHPSPASAPVRAPLASAAVATAHPTTPAVLTPAAALDVGPPAAAPDATPPGAGLEAKGGGDLARRWLPIVAPNAYGNSRFAAYWGLANTNEDAAGFAGTVAVLGAALALAVRRRRRLPQEGLLLAVLGICLLSLADPAWLHALLAAAAPALAGSRRCLLLVAFCLSYLAACTCERRRRGELGRAPLLVAAVALGAVIAWAYLAHPCPGDPERLAVLRFGWLRWQVRFLLAATLLLAVPGGMRGARRRAGWLPPGVFGVLGAAAAVGLAVVTGAELLLAHLPANPPMPMRLAFPRPAPLARLAGQLGGDRIAGLGRALPPNLASLYDMTDARVYNPMAPAAYLGLLAPITAAWWGEMPELGDPGNPLYGRLGVGYLLVAPGERLPRPWKLLLADPSGWVYRRRDVWPRLYGAATVGGEPLPGVRVTSFDEDDIAARAPVGGQGVVLAGSVYQDGGWRVLLDGRPAPAPPARRLLAAPLFTDASRAEGELHIDLLYRPRGFVFGMVATALACAAAVAWLAAPRSRRLLRNRATMGG
jgi:hypothetical protein